MFNKHNAVHALNKLHDEMLLNQVNHVIADLESILPHLQKESPDIKHNIDLVQLKEVKIRLEESIKKQ